MRQPVGSPITQRALEDEFQSPRDLVAEMAPETQKLSQNWEDDPETHIASPEERSGGDDSEDADPEATGGSRSA